MSHTSIKLSTFYRYMGFCIAASSILAASLLQVVVGSAAAPGLWLGLTVVSAVSALFVGKLALKELSLHVGSSSVTADSGEDSSSNLRLKYSLEVCQANVMVADNDMNIVFANESVTAMLKARRSELEKEVPNFNLDKLVGTCVDDFHINPSHQRGMISNLSKPHKARLPIGELIFDLIATPIFDDKGERLGTIVEWDDMTDVLAEQQVAKKIADANSRVKQALDVCEANVMVADDEMRIVYANQSAIDMLKARSDVLNREVPSLNPDTLIGTCVDDFHKDPRHQRGMISSLKDVYKTQIEVSELTFSLIATPMFNEQGERLGTVVEWQDMTDILAKQAEEKAANDANSRVLQALDSTKSNVMVADADNTIIYMNKTVQEMFKKAESDIKAVLPNFNATNLIGQNMDIFHKNPAHQKQVVGGLSSTTESEAKCGKLTFRITASPLKTDQGERLGTVVEWVDRTQEIAVEHEVQTLIQGAVDGDLTQRISLDDKQGFFASLGTGMNSLIDLIAEMIDNIKTSADLVANGAEEISSGNTNLSQRTEEQASSLEETASSMEQMTSTVQQNAENSRDADKLALAAREKAVHGGQVVSNAITAMEEINAASKRIADIIGVIDEIAFQTNLLALNASVEAARAGEQGRGFSVVASEVRNLAGRSATAAKEIKLLIQDSVSKVGEGSKLVNESGKTLQEIIAEVQKVTNVVGEISAASAEQATGIEEVNKAITQMDEMTQQNAALVEEAAAASEIMGEQAADLKRQVNYFKTQPGVARTAPAAASQASSSTSNRRSGERPWSEKPQASKPAAAKSAPARVVPLEPSKKAGIGGTDWEDF